MKAKPDPKPEEIELQPEVWERFGEFVKQIARAGPQHRPAKKEGEPKRPRGRPKKGADG